MTREALGYDLHDEEQITFARSCAGVLARDDHDSAGADEGWYGIGVSEEYGGAGGDLGDVAVMAEVIGASLSMSSAGWQAGVVAAVLERGDSAALALLRRVCEGAASVAIPTAVPVANADSPVILSGAWIALGSATSTHIAVPVAKDQRESIAFISTAHDGVRVQSLDLVDVTRSAISVEINRLPIADADAVVSYDGLIGEWLHRVCLIAALDSAGLAREVLSRTLDYAQARVQFGRVIGSFQAYKHRCATLFIKHKLGQSLAFRAAKDSSTEGTMLALAAGLLTTQYATFIAGEAVQLHGGIGYTWEAGIHRFLKRARTNEVIARSDGLGPVLLLERYRTVRAAQE